MIKQIAKRLIIALATLWAVSIVMFAAVALIPGDAATVALGQQATPERAEALRIQLGLDQPPWVQYFNWIAGIFRGELGTPILTNQPIWDAISTNVRNTLILAGLSIVVMVPLAIALGVVSAVWRNRSVDHVVSTTSLAWASSPEFVTGAVLILVFSTGLGLFPATSLLIPGVPIFEQMSAIALPLMTLVLASAAQCTRMVRAAMINALGSDYVRAAELRGVPRRRLIVSHALPNAATSIIAIVVLTIGWLVGGVVVTESLFSFPGIGSALTNAVRSQDTPTVLACSMLITGALIVANLAADIVSFFVDPRLREKRS